MLGPTLIRHQGMQEREAVQECLLAPFGMMGAFHHEPLPVDRVRRLIEQGAGQPIFGGLRTRQTCRPCCPRTSVVRAGQWPLQAWWRRDPQRDTIIDRGQTPASLSAVAPGITGYDTASATPDVQETRSSPVASGAC